MDQGSRAVRIRVIVRRADGIMSISSEPCLSVSSQGAIGCPPAGPSWPSPPPPPPRISSFLRSGLTAVPLDGGAEAADWNDDLNDAQDLIQVDEEDYIDYTPSPPPPFLLLEHTWGLNNYSWAAIGGAAAVVFVGFLALMRWRQVKKPRPNPDTHVIAA